MLDRVRQNPLIIALAIACVFAVVIAYTSVGKAAEGTTQNQRTATVQEGVVQSTVSGSGTLKPASTLSVNFAKSGTLTAVFARVGDHVTRGQLLAETSPSSAESSLKSAEITLSTDQANYEAALEGLTPAERRANEVSAEQSGTSVKSARKTLHADEATAKSDQRSATATVSQDRLALNRAKAAQSVEAESQKHTVEHAINQRTSDETKLAEARSELEKAKSTLQAANIALAERKSESPPMESKIQSAESKVSSDEANVRTLESTVKADELKVSQEDAYAITTAKTNQSAAAVKGQQTLDSSRAALQNAKRTLSSTVLKDGQTVAAAGVSLTSAEQSQQATLASNATKAQPAKNSTVVSAANSVKSAKLTVESDKQAISETRLYAPADGTIASIGKMAGEAVTGSGSSSSGESGGAASSGASEAGATGASTSGSSTGAASSSSAGSTGGTGASGASSGGTGSGGGESGAASSGTSTGTTGTSTSTTGTSTGGAAGEGGTTGGGGATGAGAAETGSAPGATSASSGSGRYQLLANTSDSGASDGTQTTGSASVGSTTTAAYTGGATAQNVASTGAAGGTSSAAGASSSSSSSSESSESTSAFIELVNVRGYQVKVPLSESEISDVRVGQDATVTVEALESKKFAATVVALPVVSSESNGVVSYDVTFQLDQTSPRLKPGMTVTAEVVVKQAEGVNVATSAIKNGSVTVLRKGKSVRQTVTTGLAGDTTTLITSGLKAGETIVLSSTSAKGASSATGASKAGAAPGGGGIGGGGGPPGGGPPGGG